MRLAVPTPTDEYGWKQLMGHASSIPVLVDRGHGMTYEYDGFRNGYASYAYTLPSGRVCRMQREGNMWSTTTMDGAVYRIAHFPEGDPNLPPSGKGWTGAKGNHNDLLNFAPTPKIEMKLREMQDTMAQPTRLGTSTPVGEVAWKPLIGVPVLFEHKYGCAYE
jgi:hypothetical protein